MQALAIKSAFNSSLKDTFCHSTLLIILTHFQFLIKGYLMVALKLLLYLLHAFNSSLKDTDTSDLRVWATTLNFQFLIKGYSQII